MNDFEIPYNTPPRRPSRVNRYLSSEPKKISSAYLHHSGRRNTMAPPWEKGPLGALEIVQRFLNPLNEPTRLLAPVCGRVVGHHDIASRCPPCPEADRTAATPTRIRIFAIAEAMAYGREFRITGAELVSSSCSDGLVTEAAVRVSAEIVPRWKDRKRIASHYPVSTYFLHIFHIL